MVLALVETALINLREAAEVRLPGSIASPQGRVLESWMVRRLREYFRELESALPTNRILALTVEMDQRWGDRKPTEEELDFLDFRVSLLIDPVVDANTRKLMAIVAPPVAIGYTEAARQIEVSIVRRFKIREIGIADALFDRPVPKEVTTWAVRRSATRVTKMDGVTKLRLRRAIRNAMDKKTRGVGQVADAIQEEFKGMSRHRAELIASTELTDAFSQGALDRATGLGSRFKKWNHVGDDRVSKKLCRPNARMGRIKITNQFKSGDTAPTSHPKCRCALAFFIVNVADVGKGLSKDGREVWLSNIGNPKKILQRMRQVRDIATTTTQQTAKRRRASRAL